MLALIVHCHPEPRSFNGALKDLAAATLRRQGLAVEVSDLYGEGFDPVEGPAHYQDRANPEVFSALSEQRHGSAQGALPPDVRREIDRLTRADLVVFQFPLWWHAPPAMLKGWLDRVFVNGGLYTSSKRYDRGHFRGRRAVCSVTTGAPRESFGTNARAGDIDDMLWPLHYSLHYMGFTVLAPYVAFGVQGHGFAYQDDRAYHDRLEATKEAWVERLAGLALDTPQVFPGWADWDDTGAQRAIER